MVSDSPRYALHGGDCLAVMPTLDADSIDAIITDPPYGLRFMGKRWDHGIPGPAFWLEALRVAKPGAYLLAFGGTRTYHRLAAAIEDAGWELRDCLCWLYGSGFPKSLDVGKAIDQAAGVERVTLQTIPDRWAGKGNVFQRSRQAEAESANITAPATAAARQWDGWGTALKPAFEPIILARKPLAKGHTVAANVLAHGTGGIHVGGCRIESEGKGSPAIARRASAAKTGKAGTDMHSSNRVKQGLSPYKKDLANYVNGNPGGALGRFPANLILSYPPDAHDADGQRLPNPGKDEVLAVFPETGKSSIRVSEGHDDVAATWALGRKGTTPRGHNDAGGSAARFFQHCLLDDPATEAHRAIYCAKASKKDRDEGCEELEARIHQSGMGGAMPVDDNGKDRDRFKAKSRNHHPTVKPTALMRYLCRLVTPPDGVVLDPFMGSGSTGKAALREGFRFIGIETDPEYLAIAAARLDHAWAESHAV